jgi:hypothetical protein
MACRGLAAAALMVASCPPGLAATAPPGWVAVPYASGEAFSPARLAPGSIIEVALSSPEPAPAPGTAAQIEWLQLRIEHDAALRPAGARCAKPALVNGSVSARCPFSTTEGQPGEVQYSVVPPAQGRIRFARLTGAGPQAQRSDHLPAITQLALAAVAELREGTSAAAGAAPARTPAPERVPEKAAGGPRVPLPLSGIQRVLLVESWRAGGLGGMLSLVYEPHVLYADHQVARGDAVPGGDDPVPAADLGRWQAQGGGYRFSWGDGKTSEPKKLHECKPATPGFTLAGPYRANSGVGNLAQGGSSSVFVSKVWHFERDGRYRREGAAGASTSAGGTAVTSTSRQPGQQGRYRLDGWRIELQPEGQAAYSLLFCRYPDSDQAIILGGTTYLQR